jgi:hypothetical protein
VSALLDAICTAALPHDQVTKFYLDEEALRIRQSRVRRESPNEGVSAEGEGMVNGSVLGVDGDVVFSGNNTLVADSLLPLASHPATAIRLKKKTSSYINHVHIPVSFQK